MSNGLVSIYRHKGALLQQVLHGATTYISDIAYNEKGQREHIYYGNNTKTRYYYNPLNFRLTRILTTRNSGIDILQDLNYTYDTVGNIIGQTDNAQQTFYFNNSVIAPTGTYTYDSLYRLIQATGRELTSLTDPNQNDFPDNIPCPNPAGNAMQNYTHNYVYDALGNMQSNAWKTYEYTTANNYLLGHNGLTNQYTYDAHGNMLTMPHLSNMDWDYQDQLHSAGNGTFISYYNYDLEGNRSRKVVVKNNIREERYYVGNYEAYKKYTNDVLDYERNTINIADDEKVFVRIETKTGESSVIRYQYDNHLGSACLELDDTGQIISYEEYHPFGTTSYRSGRTETEVSLKRYKYCGKERDEETGLYYYGMRYYAAWICRFISVDPLQFEYPHYTPYQYAGNKPISYIDLDGREEIKPIRLDLIEPETSIISHSFENGKTFMDVSFSYTEWSSTPVENYFYTAEMKTFSFSGRYTFEASTGNWVMESGTWTTETISQDFYFEKPLASGAAYTSSISEGLFELGSSLLSFGLQELGMQEQTADKAANISLFALSVIAMVLGAKGGVKAPAATTTNAAKGGSQGGLNLFKWGAEQTTKSTGCKSGDYMLYLPNKGTPKLNWKANYGSLRREMGLGKPIYDSYRLPNGNLIPTGGFLNAERFTLQSRGWIYNPNIGAWIPPIK